MVEKLFVLAAVSLAIAGAVAQWISADPKYRFDWGRWPLLSSGSETQKKAYACYVAVLAAIGVLIAFTLL